MKSPRSDRFVSAPAAFDLLVAHARRRATLSYADFADALGLGSPRGLGWLLTPLLDWCGAEGLPSLPIIVVRSADRLPSGGYDLQAIPIETKRVFDFDWSAVPRPTAADIARFALPRLPTALRGGSLPEPRPC